jgi:predicted MFS family arabinose efflux permease
LTVFFDVAHQSVLPRLIDRERLVEGNAKLQGNMSVAGVLGPAAGGGLVQALGGPSAVLVDAASYLWSAWWLRQIRPRETSRPRTGTTRLAAEIGEGLRVVFADRMLRSIGLVGASVVLFQSMGSAIDVVFLARTVGLDAGAIGLLSGVGTFGAVAAALSSRRITTRMGPIRSLAAAVAFLGIAFLILPLADTGWRVIWFVVGTLLGGYCIVAFNIVEVSYQQAICPEHLLGRMTATMRFLFRVTAPIGALLGGVIATIVGTRLTLAISGLGIIAAVAWLAPLRRQPSLSAA